MAGKPKAKGKNQSAGVGRDWLYALQKGDAGQLYVLYGEETFRRDAAVGILKKKLVTKGFEAFNYTELDGKTLELKNLEETVNRPPMMAERTLIVVTDYPLFRKKSGKTAEADDAESESEESVKDSGKDSEAMMALLSDLPPYVCLVFVYDTVECKPDARTKLYQTVKKVGEIAEFTFAPYDELSAWIRSRCSDFHVKIGAEETRFLVEHCGNSMQTLSGEIDKLCLYVRNGAVTTDDILQATCGAVEGQVFKLCDAIAEKRGREALRRLRELEQAREEPIPLLSLISRQMRNLYTARLALDNRDGRAEIAELCKFRYDFQTDTLIREARGLKLSALRKALVLCTETDAALKSSKVDEFELLYDLVLALCRTLGGEDAA